MRVDGKPGERDTKQKKNLCERDHQWIAYDTNALLYEMFFYTCSQVDKAHIRYIIHPTNLPTYVTVGYTLCLMPPLVRYAQALPAFSSTGCQYTSAVSCTHTLSKPVFIFSLPLRRLKCSFHDAFLYYKIPISPDLNRTANVQLFQ